MTISIIDYPIIDYQTYQRDCQLRWDIFKPERYIGNNGVVLDIGCAQGWFVEKSLECGAKKAIGVDVADYNWSAKGYKGEYHIIRCEDKDRSKDFDINNFDIDNFDISIDIVFLLSVPIDISIVEYIRKHGVETVFFEPYLDSENKSNWKEDEWLQRFREVGYEFYQVGIGDRDRNLYMLRRNGVYMELRDGSRVAIKTTVESNEIDFYEKFGKGNYPGYVLPYKLEMKDGEKKDGNDSKYNLVLPWAEGTLRLSGSNAESYLKDIKSAIDWIHSLGIVHGDLRVSNIVIYKGKPYLIDFSWWRYENIDEDNGVGNLNGSRGYVYINNGIMNGKLRYME